MATKKSKTAKKAKPAAKKVVAATKPPRTINPWRTPEKLMMKCFLVGLRDEKLTGNALYTAFASMVPNWRKFFDKPITDAAPVQRADKARRGGRYAGEAPEAHPVMSVMFPHAVRAVKKRQRFTNPELRKFVTKIVDKKPARARALKKAIRQDRVAPPEHQRRGDHDRNIGSVNGTDIIAI